MPWRRHGRTLPLFAPHFLFQSPFNFSLSAFGPGVAFFLEWFELLIAFFFLTFISVRLLLRHWVCVSQTLSFSSLDRCNRALSVIHLPIVPEKIELPEIAMQVFAADVVIDADETKPLHSEPRSPACSWCIRIILEPRPVSPFLLFDSEIVRDREYVGNALRLRFRNLFIHLSSNHSFQRNVAIVYDNMDRRHSAKSVLV